MMFLVILCAVIRGATAANLSISAMVRDLLQNAPEMRAATAELESRRLDATNRVAALLPKLDLSAEWGVGDATVSPPTSPWRSAFGITLTETLYDNHQSIYRLQQGRLAADQSELALSATREQVTATIMKHFWEWNRIRQQLENTRAQNQTLSDQLKRQSSLFQQGMVPERDFLRIRAQHAAIQNSILQLETDLELQELQLAQAGGWKSLAEFHQAIPSLAAQMIPDQENIEAWMRGSFERLGDETLSTEWRVTNFTARQFALRSNLLEIPVSVADRAYWPQFGVQGYAGWGVSPWFRANPSARGVWNWSVWATVHFNLWDWGTLRRSREIARADQVVGEAQLSRDRLDLEFSAESTAKRLVLTRKILNQSIEILSTNRKTFRQIAISYREGGASYLDYIGALQDSLNAKNAVANGFFSWMKGKSDALALEGRGYETWTHLD